MTDYAVLDPATGQTVATYPTATDEQVDASIAAADEAARTWGRTATVAERAALVREHVRRSGEPPRHAADALSRDAVQALVGRHPALAEQLLTADGELHRFVNVFVNGRDVRYLEGLATPVADRDEIRLLPAIAGGSAGHARPEAED